MARSADSRPEPGPDTSTSSVRMPCSEALRTASSAAIWAAKGVDLREPLNPMVPAEDQEIVLPCASVTVIMVLLNDECTCATPETIFLRSRRRTRVVSLAIFINSFGRAPLGAPCNCDFAVRLLLLAGDGLGLALAGAGVGVGALAAHRQLPPVAQAAIGSKIHQALDVHRHLAPQVALDHVIAVDRLADLEHLGVAELRHAPLGRNLHLVDDFLGLGRPDAVNVLERDDDALVGWDIDACDAGHFDFPSISAANERKRSKTPRGCDDSASGGGRPLPRSVKTQKVPGARNAAGTQNVIGRSEERRVGK